MITKYRLLVMFMCLQVIDFSTTYLGVSFFGAHEKNPVALFFISNLGLVLTLILFKGFAGCWACYGVFKKGDGILKRAVWIYSVAMAWNILALSVHFHNWLVLNGHLS